MSKYFPWVFSLPSLVFFIVLGLGGCSVKQEINTVPIGLPQPFQLESPASYGGQLSVTQKLEIDYAGEHREVVAQVEIDEKQLNLVAWGPMGIFLFSISWDGMQIKVMKAPGLRLHFPPEYLLVDMQLALWPNFPANPGLPLQEQPKRRILRGDGAPILIIDYPQGRKGMPEIHIHQVEKDYRLQITRLD